jgi:hypothetical protein
MVEREELAMEEEALAMTISALEKRSYEVGQYLPPSLFLFEGEGELSLGGGDLAGRLAPTDAFPLWDGGVC